MVLLIHRFPEESDEIQLPSANTKIFFKGFIISNGKTTDIRPVCNNSHVIETSAGGGLCISSFIPAPWVRLRRTQEGRRNLEMFKKYPVKSCLK